MRQRRKREALATFSIHYWIVFLETQDHQYDDAKYQDFQYPLLDRISWNSRSLWWKMVVADLSVSTIGSYFLKQFYVRQVIVTICSFSIHYWIVFLETGWLIAQRVDKPELSVSTIGSYFLKPYFRMSSYLWQLLSVSTIGSYFLKPRPRARPRKRNRLSVSTIGSYFLKLESQANTTKPRGAFSIHYWIVFLETSATCCCWAAAADSFSIHYWIVFLETVADHVRWHAENTFQYPLLDRISWNEPDPPRGCLLLSAFSIHYWIVFLETWQPLLWRRVQRFFQYPLLDRISWNCWKIIVIRLLFSSFSIHYWIVFLETLRPGNMTHAFVIFQYPLLDRISWNPELIGA